MELGAYMLVWLAAACPWAALAPAAVETALVYETPAYNMVEMFYGVAPGSSQGLAVVWIDCQVYLRAPLRAETACHELRHCTEGAFHG